MVDRFRERLPERRRASGEGREGQAGLPALKRSRWLLGAALAAASAGPLASCRQGRGPSPPPAAPAVFGSVAGRAPGGTVVFLADPLDPDGNLATPGGVPARGAQLRLRGGKVEPGISAVSLGGEIVLTSEDETFSDVSAYYGLTELAFHRKFVLAGDRFSFAPVRPGLMLFEDENRPSDRSYLYVAPTPAFAVAGEDGRYEIARAPAGRRRFTAWNLEKGVRDAEASVRKGETTALDFEFPK